VVHQLDCKWHHFLLADARLLLSAPVLLDDGRQSVDGWNSVSIVKLAELWSIGFHFRVTEQRLRVQQLDVLWKRLLLWIISINLDNNERRYH
jgi:hypothetical protein